MNIDDDCLSIGADPETKVEVPELKSAQVNCIKPSDYVSFSFSQSGLEPVFKTTYQRAVNEDKPPAPDPKPQLISMVHDEVVYTTPSVFEMVKSALIVEYLRDWQDKFEQQWNKTLDAIRLSPSGWSTDCEAKWDTKWDDSLGVRAIDSEYVLDSFSATAPEISSIPQGELAKCEMLPDCRSRVYPQSLVHSEREDDDVWSTGWKALKCEPEDDGILSSGESAPEIKINPLMTRQAGYLAGPQFGKWDLDKMRFGVGDTIKYEPEVKVRLAASPKTVIYEGPLDEIRFSTTKTVGLGADPKRVLGINTIATMLDEANFCDKSSKDEDLTIGTPEEAEAVRTVSRRRETPHEPLCETCRNPLSLEEEFGFGGFCACCIRKP